MRAVEAGDEVLDELRKILASQAERRQPDSDDAQPIVQIAPELPRFDHAPQVAVGGCDDPHVDSPEGGGAERLHLVVLDGTQELGLERRGEVLDLVEEERAAVCELEHARPFLQGAGESPAGVAEELGFGERFRHGRAVHRDEGAGSAPTQRVDGARDELLARPRLALDEYLRLGRGRHADERTHLVHGAAPADEAAERLAGRGGRARRTAATDRSRAEEAGDRVRNLVRVSIEHHVVGRPGLHGGDRVRGPVLGAHHEERNGGPPCPRRPHDVEGPGAVDRPGAEHHQAGRALLRCRVSGRGRRSDVDVGPGTTARRRGGKQVGTGCVVVDHENVHGAAGEPTAGDAAMKPVGRESERNTSGSRGRSDRDQERTRVDRRSGDRLDGRHAAGNLRDEGGLHLHRLEHDDRLSRLDRVAQRDHDGDDLARHGRHHLPRTPAAVAGGGDGLAGLEGVDPPRERDQQAIPRARDERPVGATVDLERQLLDTGARSRCRTRARERAHAMGVAVDSRRDPVVVGREPDLQHAGPEA